MTGITVLFFVISHVFHPADILFIFSCFGFFIVIGFDEGYLSVFFEKEIVLFTFVSCIGYDITVMEGQVFVHIL